MSSGEETGATTQEARTGSRLLLILGLILIAFNLRPTLTVVAPVLNAIRADYSFDATMAGLLTMLPVLCLGIFGAIAAKVARRYGAEATILGFVLLIAAGSLLRGAGSPAALFVGTAFGGAGIGVVGVLLPAIVKRDFSANAGMMTGLFTMTLVFGAAVGAGATIPLAGTFGGWEPALMFWAVPALVAALVWLPQLVLHRFRPRDTAPPASLWRDPLAWQVTLFMGLQSSIAYMTMGWMPVILEDFGMTAAAAGYVSSVSIASQMITALLVPPLAARQRDQRAVLVANVALATFGMAGLIFAPLSLVWVFAIMLGLSLGGCFGVALTLIVLRTRDGRMAAELSAMSQSVGYVLASLGPFMIGWLYDLSGGWSVPGLFFIAVTLVAMAVGVGAGRARHVGE